MIDIFTCLTGNSAPYANYLAANLLQNASKPSRIRLHAICDQDFVGDVPQWNIVETMQTPFQKGVGNNGANHASMLNRVVHHIPVDSQFVIIADVDVAILKERWDLYLINVMADSIFDAWITPKFSGATSVFFSIFRASLYRRSALDFRPGTLKNGWKTKTVMMDTGYRLREQLKGCHWTMFDYQHDSELQYVYCAGGSPFVAHMGASHRKSFDREVATQWRDGVYRYLTGRRDDLHLPHAHQS